MMGVFQKTLSNKFYCALLVDSHSDLFMQIVTSLSLGHNNSPGLVYVFTKIFSPVQIGRAFSVLAN